MRRETGDSGMQPLGHALSTLVPGWNAWQTWKHFRRIDALLESAGRTERVDAMTGALGMVIWWLTFTHYASDPLFLVLDAIELVAGTAVLVYGQRGLNVLWAARGAVERVTQTDLIVLAIAGTYAVSTVVAFLSSTP
jgi:hypothetical protein